jgi:hypothetical protein
MKTDFKSLIEDVESVKNGVPSLATAEAETPVETEGKPKPEGQQALDLLQGIEDLLKTLVDLSQGEEPETDKLEVPDEAALPKEPEEPEHEGTTEVEKIRHEY